MYSQTLQAACLADQLKAAVMQNYSVTGSLALQAHLTYPVTSHQHSTTMLHNATVGQLWPLVIDCSFC